MQVMCSPFYFFSHCIQTFGSWNPLRRIYRSRRFFNCVTSTYKDKTIVYYPVSLHNIIGRQYSANIIVKDSCRKAINEKINETWKAISWCFGDILSKPTGNGPLLRNYFMNSENNGFEGSCSCRLMLGTNILCSWF